MADPMYLKTALIIFSTHSTAFVAGFMTILIHPAQTVSCLSWYTNQSVTANKHAPCSPVRIFVARDTKLG